MHTLHSTIERPPDEGIGGHEPVTRPPFGRDHFGRDFWVRPDVERARQMLDLWASCKRANLAGVDGCPTAEAIFERPAPVLGPRLDRRTGLWITDEELFIPTSSHNALPEPRVAELAVDSFFRELGTPRLAVSLLYFLYPRSGPYEQEGEIGEFRPRALFGRLGGKYLDRARTALANQLHRETVLRLAGLCQHGAFETASPEVRGTTESQSRPESEKPSAEAQTLAPNLNPPQPAPLVGQGVTKK